MWLFSFGLDFFVLVVEAFDNLIGDVHGGVHVERGTVVECLAAHPLQLLRQSISCSEVRNLINTLCSTQAAAGRLGLFFPLLY